LIAAFDFHGVRIRLESAQAQVLEALRRDFSWFSVADDRPPEISWTFCVREPAAGPARGWRARDFRAWDEGRTRRVLYDGGARAGFDFASGRGEAECADPLRLHEIVHLAVLAGAGERLDARGLHRVHALGFVRSGAAGLLLLPSGGGKSELGLRLLGEPGFSLLSDDTPLLGADLVARPFPLRLSFRESADLSALGADRVRSFRRRLYGERRLVDVDAFRARIAAPAPLRWVLLGRRADARPGEIGSAGAHAAALELAAALVVGVGVPQMAEWRLRPNAACAGALARAALARAATAVRALARARLGEFRLDRDPQRSAALLAGWLDRAV